MHTYTYMYRGLCVIEDCIQEEQERRMQTPGSRFVEEEGGRTKAKAKGEERITHLIHRQRCRSQKLVWIRSNSQRLRRQADK